MVKELRLPELGENIESAVVGAVLVSPGDAVQVDQAVIEVETDKATAEVPSPFEGVVKEIKVKTGDDIRVDQVILTVEANGAVAADATGARASSRNEPARASGAGPSAAATTIAEAPASDDAGEAPTDGEPRRRETGGSSARATAARSSPSRAAAAAARAPAARPSEAPAPPKGDAEDPVPASPSVRRLARELGLDIAEVPGSGPGGRISVEDVQARARGLISSAGSAAAGAGAAHLGAELPDFSRWGEVERQPMSGIRRATAERMGLAWSTVPHVTQFDQADITEIEAFRRAWRPRGENPALKLTITAIALKVTAAALRVFPRFNASLDAGRQEIVFKKYVHLGVAVDAGHGLLVPVIRSADEKNILEIAAELAELSRKAREKKLTLEEMSGASFTVTNLGGLGTTQFSPIVNWPDAAILGIGRAATQAVHDGASFQPRLILPLSLSYDHRLNDGADAARFLRWIAEALEQPLKVALEG